MRLFSKDPAQPAGAPGIEAGKTALATAVSAIPVAGPLISGLALGAMQADTIRKLNEAFQRLDTLIAQHALPVDRLLADPVFRQGMAEIHLGVLRQEADAKISRILLLLENHLSSAGIGVISSEAVFKALLALPSSHIEAFLALVNVTGDLEDLRDTALAAGDIPLDPDAIVATEFPDASDQDHCGSPADARYTELVILFESLQGAGLARRVPADRPLFETTGLAKAFILNCIPPAAASPEDAA